MFDCVVCVGDAVYMDCVNCEEWDAVVLVRRVRSGEEEIIPCGWQVLLVEDGSCCLCEWWAVVKVS